MATKRLYRSETDKKLGGLCGGLAEYLNVDATLLRLIVAIAVVFSAGTALVIYILGCLVVPTAPRGSGTERTFNTMNDSAFGFQQSTDEPDASKLDEMMKEVEKKAMRQEIEDLKEKIAQLEKNNINKGD